MMTKGLNCRCDSRVSLGEEFQKEDEARVQEDGDMNEIRCFCGVIQDGFLGESEGFPLK
jgi:hypothetical protein